MVYGQVIVLIKRTLFFIPLLLLALSLPIRAGDGPAVSAVSAVLYDPLSDTVLYEKSADVRRGMASTTKIMTALIALEQYDLDQQVKIRREWCGIEGSSIYLKPDEVLTVSDLLYGLLLKCGSLESGALGHSGLIIGVVVGEQCIASLLD